MKRAALLALTLLGCSSSTAPKETALAGGVDCHLHLRHKGQLQPVPRILKALDEAGLQRGCLLSYGYHKPPGCQERPCAKARAFTQAANDQTLQAAAKSDRLHAFCGISLTHSWGPEELSRCVQAGARGLKLHPVSERLSVRTQKIDAQLRALLAEAARLSVVVLIHVDFEEEAEVMALFEAASQQPDVKVIVAHQLGGQASLLAKAPPNVYADISGLAYAPLQAAPFFVGVWRKIGVERVLLGSDWPLLSPKDHVQLLKRYPLTKEERAMIIGGNAGRLGL